MAYDSKYPIPERMQHLTRDHRGLPHPFILFEDKDGRKHFQINDSSKMMLCKMDLLCSLCGKPLLDDPFDDNQGMWFVGGPMSAMHPRGAYVDPPVHQECGDYALHVCPYLAMPLYVDGSTEKLGKTLVEKDKLPNGCKGFVDTSMPEYRDRPPVFVFLQVSGYAVDLNEQNTMRPPIMKNQKQIMDYQFWKDGVQLEEEVAIKLIRMHELAKQAKPNLIVPK